jgi:hypothetical protein
MKSPVFAMRLVKMAVLLAAVTVFSCPSAHAAKHGGRAHASAGMHAGNHFHNRERASLLTAGTYGRGVSGNNTWGGPGHSFQRRAGNNITVNGYGGNDRFFAHNNSYMGMTAINNGSFQSSRSGNGVQYYGGPGRNGVVLQDVMVSSYRNPSRYVKTPSGVAVGDVNGDGAVDATDH